jgi:hypothetical protein
LLSPKCATLSAAFRESTSTFAAAFAYNAGAMDLGELLSKAFLSRKEKQPLQLLLYLCT